MILYCLRLARRARNLSAAPREVDSASGEQRRKQGFPLQDTGLPWLVHLRRRREQFLVPCMWS